MIEAPDELLVPETPSSRPPETRVKDGHAARQIVERLIQEDEPRGNMRAVVKGCIDGNPPYNEAKRKAAGLGWTANLNFMEGKGIMESSGVPYYQLFNGVEYYADTKTAHDPENDEHGLWHGKIACRFHNMLKRWSAFDWNVQMASYQMRLHGTGPCVFPKKGDWRFKAVASGSILVDKASPSCVDERHSKIALRDTYSVVDLYDCIRGESAASSAGWNVQAVKNAVVNAANTPGSQKQTTWEDLQQRLKNNDLATSTCDCTEIRVAHLFVREFSGKVSHFIVTEDAIVPKDGKQPNQDEKPKDDAFLFKSPNCYDNYGQALVVFFISIGDGTWHSVRGIASDAFRHLEASNRLKNRMLDGAFIESSLVIQAATAKSAEALRITQIGPVTVIPAGATLQQTKLAGFLDGPIAVDRIVTNHLANNIGMYNQRTMSREDGRGEVPTATQVNAAVAKESSLNQGQITLFYSTMDMIYAEVFRRAADPNTSDPEAKRFQEECEKDGVPKKALQNMEYVRANRASGYGSPQMRQLTDQQMMPFVPMLPEKGRQNFLEDAIGGIKGADKVRRYVPQEHIPDQDDSIAALENGLIGEGRQPVVASGQNHVTHLHSHLGDAADTLEPLQEAIEQGQADQNAIAEAVGYTQLMAAHVQEHIARLQADPTRKQMAEMFNDQLANIVSFHGRLRSALIQARREAELQAEQEQQATALSALDQAKLESAQLDMQIKSDKAQNDMRIKTIKSMHGMRLKNLQTADSIRVNRVSKFAETASAV